jgi:group I intron endonuclease
MNTFYIVYKTTCLINYKIYVGQHVQINTSAVDSYLGSGTAIEDAIKKYGKKNFIRENIEYCTSANLSMRENYWIDELSATNPNIGYNLMSGVDNIVWTPERKAYLSRSFLGENNPMWGKGYMFVGSKNHFYGKHHSEESKKKIGSRYYPKSKQHHNFGKKLSEEHKTKFSFKGHKHSPQNLKKISESSRGRKHSKETLQKCREINLGYNNPNSKYLYIIENTQCFEIFDSVSLMCEKYNLNQMGVFTSLRKYNGNYKNYHIERILKNI